MPVESQTQQRQSMRVRVSRIERQIPIPIRHHAPLRRNWRRMAVMLAYRGLPPFAPSGRSRWNHHLIDGSAAGRAGIDERSADESQLCMIEMIRIELINDSQTCRARSDERIDFDILAEVDSGLGTHLVGVVLAHEAFPGDRI